MKQKLGFAVVVTALICAGLFYQVQRRPSPVQRRNLITELAAKEVLAKVQALKTPVVLVNFWASWCEPCKKEFPRILALREKWAKKGLSVVFVSIDEPQDLDAAETFLEQQHVNFETFTKGDRSLAYVNEIYPQWEGAVPTTLLFDPQLKILDAWEGDATMEEFEQRVAHQLGGS